jgi:hypothetical protein
MKVTPTKTEKVMDVQKIENDCHVASAVQMHQIPPDKKKKKMHSIVKYIPDQKMPVSLDE